MSLVIHLIVKAICLARFFSTSHCFRFRRTPLAWSMAKLYHQTDAETAEIILRTQRMKPGSGGLAGGGIYFATTPELTGHKAHKNGVILEATVSLGKVHTLDAPGDPDMTLQKLKSKGFDSVCIARAVSSGQEYVVYDPEQVLSIVRATDIPISRVVDSARDDPELVLSIVRVADSPIARFIDSARSLFGVNRVVESEGVPPSPEGNPSASEPPQPPASPAKPKPQPTPQPPPKAPAMAVRAPQPPPSQPPVAPLATKRRLWWGSRLTAPLIRWRKEKALKDALASGRTLKQLRARVSLRGSRRWGLYAPRPRPRAIL